MYPRTARRFGCFLAVLALACLGAAQAQAQGKVRIAQQFGLSYLPLHVALELKLIEKHAKAIGEGDVTIEVVRLASGAAVNDAIISGSIDVAMAGLTVLLNLRDKTVGSNTVKGMMAIADSPIYFNTTDPRIQSVKDFQETDRIAMTAGRGTQHAVILQMAAAAAFGWDNREKLDALAVGISHPDGVIGLLSGGGNFKTHATTVPFIQMELADPRVRTLFSSYDVIGRRHTLIVAYSAERWRRESPSCTSPRLRPCPKPWTSSARIRARQRSCSCAASPRSWAWTPSMASSATRRCSTSRRRPPGSWPIPTTWCVPDC